MVATLENPNMKALLDAIEALPEELFTAYRGGCRDAIGVELLDAVYSIQATYDSEHPERGVLNRVKRFKSQYPAAADDLRVLASLEEQAIQAVMGDGKTSQRTKSGAVREAAHALIGLELPIV